MISLNWVGDYIDIKDQDVHELATKITKAGINIEGVVTHNIDNLVIGCIAIPLTKLFFMSLSIYIYVYKNGAIATLSGVPATCAICVYIYL